MIGKDARDPQGGTRGRPHAGGLAAADGNPPWAGPEPVQTSKRSRILAFGDSHACFWEGRDETRLGAYASKAFSGLDVIHLGPITAHSISRPDGRQDDRSLLLGYLRGKRETYGCLIFCFGEIDCRNHIVRVAGRDGVSIRVIAERTARQYVEFAARLAQNLGAVGVLWGPTPTFELGLSGFNAKFPTVGSRVERDYATQAFSQALTELASTYPYLAHIDLINGFTDAAASEAAIFFDGCHLSSKLLPAARNRLLTALVAMGADDLVPAIAFRPRVTKAWGLRNIAAGLPYVASSAFANSETKPFGARADDGWKFVTTFEDAPHIVMDLKSSYWVKKVVAHGLGCSDDGRPRALRIALSSDNVTFPYDIVPAGRDHGPARETARGPLTAEIDTAEPVRFVKFTLVGRGHLHLEGIEIYVKSFEAAHSTEPAGLVNVAFGKPCRQSSGSRWSNTDGAGGAVDGRLGDFGFHTDLENAPWWSVDLESVCAVELIRIFNREDFETRALSLYVESSLDGTHWTVVHENNGWFFGSARDGPLLLEMAPTSMRYVRLGLRTHDYFHLQQVEVWASPVAADHPRRASKPPLPEHPASSAQGTVPSHAAASDTSLPDGQHR